LIELNDESVLSRVQSANCLSDPRSAADAYEIYYATFIAIKSAHRIALSSSPTFSKRALYRWRRQRLALRVPTFTVDRHCREIEIASSEDSSTTRGGLSRRYEVCIRPTGTKDEAEDEDRETTEEERKEDFAREKDGRRDARLSRQGGKGRDGD